MRIGLIRHFPVKKEFLKGRVRQSQVLDWFAQYDAAPVAQMAVAASGIGWQKCYASQLPRAVETARALHPGPIACSALLNEPTPCPVFRKDVRLPFLLWGVVMRSAILFNHPSQEHRKEVVERRVRTLLGEVLQEGGGDVLIVSHVFTMEILSRLLLAEGFKGKKLRRPQNGRLYVYHREEQVG